MLPSMNQETCGFCPRTTRIQELIKSKSNDATATENILTNKISLDFGAGEERETSFEDLTNEIGKRYPDWETSPITVPAYTFSGLEKNKTWTESDIRTTLIEAKQRFISQCLCTSDSNISEHVLAVCKQNNLKITESLHEKICLIVEESDEIGQPPDFNNLSNDFLQKKFPRYISQLNNIVGKKCESKVRMNNHKKLKSGPGLILSNLRLYKDIGNMLEKFGIASKVKRKNAKVEIEYDSIVMKVMGNHIIIEIQEIKAFSTESSWRGESQLSEQEEEQYFRNIVEKGLQQLEKEIEAFLNIFSFLTDEELKKIRIVPRCILPNYSRNPRSSLFCQNCSKIVHCKEDFERRETPAAMFSPFTPPDILFIYKKMLAIYVGVGSLIEIKTPKQGYNKEKIHLQEVSNMMYQPKIVMLGSEQMKVAYQMLNNYSYSSCVLIGPYGSGKTLAIEFLITKIESLITTSSKKIQVIIIIWDDGAKDLLKYYHDKRIIPESKIFKKSDALNYFGIEIDDICIESTSTQINQLFKMINEKSVDFDETFVFIDEVLVVTEDDELLGNAPFVYKGQPVDWSNLNPLGITTYIAVTPESECYLNPREYEKEKILENNERSLIPTYVLSRTYRTNINIFEFIKFIQSNLEKDGHLGFNLKSTEVFYGHEIVGESPQWSPQKVADHMKCNKESCDDCFLNKNVLNIINSLLKDVAKEDATIVVIESLVNKRRYKCQLYSKLFIKNWFKKNGFHTNKIKFDFEFEGMESPVMILLQNNGDMSGSLSNVLTRAISRLFIVSPQGDKYLESALAAELLTKVTEPSVDDTSDDSDSSMPDLDSDTGSLPSETSSSSPSDSEDEEDSRIRCSVPPHLRTGSFQIPPDSKVIITRSQSTDDLPSSRVRDRVVFQSTEDILRERDYLEIDILALLTDIANIFIYK